MSFDRLLDPRYLDTSMKEAITVKATGNGRYRAKWVPPVFGVGPALAERLLVIDGLEETIEVNPKISEERKMFLKERIPLYLDFGDGAERGRPAFPGSRQTVQ